MTDKTFMRVDKQLLDEIRRYKITKRESYADVVKRIIDMGINDPILKKMKRNKV